jgi:hypothetical protein
VVRVFVHRHKKAREDRGLGSGVTHTSSAA